MERFGFWTQKRSSNYRTIADSGEAYSSKYHCLHGIEVLKEDNGSYQAYVDARGEHRWRFRGHNGRIVADSAEGYDSDSNCKGAIEMVRREAPTLTPKIEADVRGPEVVMERRREVQSCISAPDETTRLC